VNESSGLLLMNIRNTKSTVNKKRKTRATQKRGDDGLLCFRS